MKFKMLLLTVFVLLGACATQEPLIPTVDYKPGYDFAALETFSLLSTKRSGPNPAQMSEMEMHRADRAFIQALESHGLRYVEDRNEADLLVSWLLLTEDRTDVRGYDARAYYQCWGCGPAVSDVRVKQYTQGTLIVDLIDPRLSQSVWRSYVQSRLTAEPDVEGQQGRFNAVADTMLEAFPR